MTHLHVIYHIYIYGTSICLNYMATTLPLPPRRHQCLDGLHAFQRADHGTAHIGRDHPGRWPVQRTRLALWDLVAWTSSGPWVARGVDLRSGGRGEDLKKDVLLRLIPLILGMFTVGKQAFDQWPGFLATSCVMALVVVPRFCRQENSFKQINHQQYLMKF